ncbi:MAG: hypothetical protein HYW49_00365 [Deltaproteobacteria bacterium]|nr:hypothetical protein [Deltaproteobacteria bacterium]
MRKLKISTAFIWVALAATTAFMTGCSAQQQTQQKVTELANKMAESDRKLSALDSDLKKAAFEITQLKNVVSRMGDVVVNLQRAGESKHAKSNGASARKAAPKSKKLPAKKKHAR